jgi:predicted AlkP superfamily pyrophosphatase or phosphodiesterase
MKARSKLLVVSAAALGWDQARRLNAAGFSFKPTAAVFPALTCVAQASFRTAATPDAHGMVANGLWFPELKKVLFWEQAASLVEGPRIWDALRAAGRTVGMLFWQQILGESVDIVLSPRPIHKHQGGMIQDCYSQPSDLYAHLCSKLGRSFNLTHYWGPLASRKSSEWIADATCAIMADDKLAPDLLFVYLPHLDYDLQRQGPESSAAARARDVLGALLAKVRAAAESSGYDWLVFGDYSIGPVTAPAIFPNRALREAGLFWTRSVKGMAYPDFFNSHAFAVVDHEIAHIFARDGEAKRKAREVLEKLPGIESVIEGEARRSVKLLHRRTGDLVLVARRGTWFAYPWWTDRREAPDYATHIDIHNKPGYDPCELFFGWPPLSISLNTARVKGSHGRATDADAVAWAGSVGPTSAPASLIDLAAWVRDWCNEMAARSR